MSVQSSESSQVSEIVITSNGDSISFKRFSILLKFVLSPRALKGMNDIPDLLFLSATNWSSV